MGLDCSHDAFHGAYSAFTRFRNMLWEADGGTLQKYEYGYESAAIDWDRFELKNFMGEWDTPPDDPLFLLIVHSDCEGIIPSAYCEHLANRIEPLIPKLPTEGAGHMAQPQEKARAFVAGLRLAAEEGEDLDFH